MIGWKHIILAGFFILTLICGLALPFIPAKTQMILVLAIPALLMLLLIIKNPYAGIIIYFLFEYSRPYDMIPGLARLRIPMLTVLLTLVSFLLYNFRSSKTIKWSSFNWFYLAFLGVAAAMVPFAVNNRYAYDTFQGLAINFAIFIIATNTVNTVSRLKTLVWLLMGVHLFLALKGIGNYFSGAFVFQGMYTSGRVGSSFLGDENDFALALNVFIPFAFFMISVLKKKTTKITGAVILSVLVFGVISSMSRGGWVGLTAAILFALFRSKRKLVGIMIITLLGAIVVAVAPSKYWDEISSISDTQEGTAQARFQYWIAAVKMFTDHPVFGVGAANGGIWMPSYIQSDRDPNTQWGRTFHGTLPQVIAELGGLGLGLYLLMAYLALSYAKNAQRAAPPGADRDFVVFMSNSIMGGIIAFLVTATFLSAAYYPQLWTMFTLSVTVHFICKAIILAQKNSENGLINARNVPESPQ